MSNYRGKYYKAELLKARQNYVCAISNWPIYKGEHYLCLSIENGNNCYSSLGYIPTEVVRVSKQVLASYTMDEILDATNRFETDCDKYVRRITALQKENTFLHEAVDALRKISRECLIEKSALKDRANKIFGKEVDEPKEKAVPKEPKTIINRVMVEHCKDELKRLYGLEPYNTVNVSRDDNYYWAAIRRNFSADIIALAKKELGI